MFAKLFNKQSDSQKIKAFSNLNPQVIAHYGIPSTASRLAYDPVQQLLAVGTQDGRIKVIGSYNIEGILKSTKEIPFKNLEFLQNRGFLIAISNENDIEVWDLEQRCIASTLHWESNITSFSVIEDSNYIYLGDDHGLVSVLKYDSEERKILRTGYSISAQAVSEATGILLRNDQSVVGVLPQPCSSGSRLLFAYDNGVIILWDITKDQLVHVRGCNSSENFQNEENVEKSDDEQGDKEIISMCWASVDGSLLAVGYVDGDILFWNFSEGSTSKDQKTGKSTNNVVKLQLSSAENRFPVIVLRWSARRANDDHDGQLFIYGGDEIGSAEVLTILTIEFSPKKDALKTVKRANVTLQGSFADMALLQNFSVTNDVGTTSLFLLTSPGQLQYYDSSCLSGLTSHNNKSRCIPLQYKSVVPTTEPYITISRFISMLDNSTSSEALSKMGPTVELQSDESSKWPLNGGVPCHLSLHREKKVERLYVAGYQDGSVRIWDATYPVLSLIFLLDPEVRGLTKAGVKRSVSALDISAETLNIAIGNDSGAVHIHNLMSKCKETRLNVVSGAKNEVDGSDQGKDSHVSTLFTLNSSPVSTLRFTNLGVRLAVGYENGQVAMLNISSSAVLYFIDSLTSPHSHVVSFSPAISLENYCLATTLDQSQHHGESELGQELICALTNDLPIDVLDTSDGNVICSVSKDKNKESSAISMYILDGNRSISERSGGTFLPSLSQEDNGKAENAHDSGDIKESADNDNIAFNASDLRILVCGTDVLLLYSLKSVIQGQVDCISEVGLQKTICWTTIFKKGEDEWLLVFYQTGSIEIRSLQNLEVLGELSLLSILRWNFRTNMEKTMSCTDKGQITLANGCEFVILSLLDSENDFRVPQTLPCLYDEALAAALDLSSPSQKKNKQETSSGILGGIMKSLRASKESQTTNLAESPKSLLSALDKVFSGSKTDTSKEVKDDGKVVELNLDDIKIDEPLRVEPITHNKESQTKDKSAERKKLFEGGTSETKARPRTVDEIKAKYRKPGDTSSATASAFSSASEARNKLLERKEKLERIDQNSEELRNNAENFASMAKELAKRMENRKWWQL